MQASREAGTTTPRPAARVALALALVFAVLGVALAGLYLHDLRLLAQTARKVDAGRNLTPEQRLVEYVAFADREIRDPKIQDLPPLVRLYYRLNPQHPGAGDVLRWGSDYRGGCGSHTRVVTAMLQSAGIPCRTLLLLDDKGESYHSVVEAKIGGRWVIGDAYYGIVFRRADGALATAEEIRRDRATFLAQVEHVPGYDVRLYDYDPVTRFNWNKIPVVLPAIRRLLVRLIGESRVRDIVRPSIWIWPQESYSLLCLLLAGGFGMLAMRLR
jgi:hypothetical protein